MLKENTPRHEQISDWLREAITGGEFGPQDKLPSENKLAKKFDVSRITVRHALQTLEYEELIYRKQGLGSFVNEQKIEQPLVRLHDFMEEMAKAGLEASSRVIAFRQERAGKDICDTLALEEQSLLTRLDRVRLGNGQPVAFDITWLPLLYGQLLVEHNMEKDTIYGVLEREYQVPIVNGRYQVSAAKADSYVARHLNVNEGTALLEMDRVSCTIARKKVYYQKRYYRTDRMTYEIFLERAAEDQPGSENSKDFPLKEFGPVFH